MISNDFAAMKRLKLATSNARKAQEIEEILEMPVDRLDLDLIEVQAIDVADVIEAKARDAYAKAGIPVLVEDTGLYINGWNGLPGALITWFMKTVDDAGICRMLDGWENRAAYAQTMIGLFDGEIFRGFSGTLTGSIALAPRGENGFGWDTILIPDGSPRTLAEMKSAEKNAISMRKRAAEELRVFLIDSSDGTISGRPME